MAVKKIYGLRIYKDGNPCTEHLYFSLEQIHKRTMLYNDQNELSQALSNYFKEKNNTSDDKSFYSAQIVYYPNKEETKRIAKNSEVGNFESNGVSSEYVPILYKKDKKIFDLKYMESRFYSLLTRQNPSFRERLKEYYDSSMKPDKDKHGNDTIKSSINIYRDVLSIIRAYNNGTSKELEFNIGKLYDKVIIGSLAERTKIYTIMENEFPTIEKKQPVEQTPVEPETVNKPEIPWLDYCKLDQNTQAQYRCAPMQEGDALKLASYFVEEARTIGTESVKTKR